MSIKWQNNTFNRIDLFLNPDTFTTSRYYNIWKVELDGTQLFGYKNSSVSYTLTNETIQCAEDFKSFTLTHSPASPSSSSENVYTDYYINNLNNETVYEFRIRTDWVTSAKRRTALLAWGNGTQFFTSYYDSATSSFTITLSKHRNSDNTIYISCTITYTPSGGSQQTQTLSNISLEDDNKNEILSLHMDSSNGRTTYSGSLESK